MTLRITPLLLRNEKLNEKSSKQNINEDKKPVDEKDFYRWKKKKSKKGCRHVGFPSGPPP